VRSTVVAEDMAAVAGDFTEADFRDVVGLLRRVDFQVR
jgi:hypothetical protein